jgi:hypothetical protein
LATTASKAESTLKRKRLAFFLADLGTEILDRSSTTQRLRWNLGKRQIRSAKIWPAWIAEGGG